MISTLAAVMPSGSGSEATGDPAAAMALLLYILLALLFSFLCSITEAVLLSLTPSYIEGLQDSRPGLARLLQRLKVTNVDRSLAAILTLNTIAHTVGAIGAGAKAVEVFGSAYFGVFSAVMTLLILFVSEIVPKTIGAVYWRSLTAFTAWFVQILIWLLYPLLRITELLTRMIARGKKDHILSRNEMAAMANLGVRSGTLRPEESRIIHNLLLFENVTVGDIMTPRTVVLALPEDSTVALALTTAGLRPFSRLPVYSETIDRITGFVLKEDLLHQQGLGEDAMPLTELKRDMPTVHKNMRLYRLLDIMMEEPQAHIATVIDEYGGTEGIVTMEDLFETLLGLEVVDERDEAEDMQVFARKRWRARAKAMGLNVDEDVPRRGAQG